MLSISFDIAKMVWAQVEISSFEVMFCAFLYTLAPR